MGDAGDVCAGRGDTEIQVDVAGDRGGHGDM